MAIVSFIGNAKDTKLTQFGTRDYEAEIGRWIMTDPIGVDGKQVDLYP
ncbi:hypothetical protein [Beggiatoa leptomitoformis]|uniref:Uncharacterized protein n=1 Tax=Beggiatoa leptomitoformis TaxID=288004 RepID=A0A650GE22_9GAMM|nr:hypothetical protein [Beggiatoa leptomitoformis]QGX03828.1 hypothetical protein AL038_19500 [Beggiatoa leptomitoformis]QGX04138.1 hypothetical protein BLE401_18770 [Beggiatoa leptomitoformis]